MDGVSYKKPHEILNEIVQVLERKGIPSHEILKFIEELESAVKNELALELAKRVDVEQLEGQDSKNMDTSDTDQMASMLGIDEEMINDTLWEILTRYKKQLEDTLHDLPDVRDHSR
jgi:hypothetical protein